MKFVAGRSFADPEVARKLMEIANSVEAVQDDRIHVEKISWPFPLQAQGFADRIQRRPQARDRMRQTLKYVAWNFRMFTLS
jgi:hypothetical protein